MAKTRITPKKKPKSISYYKKLADKLFSERVRVRGFCEKCRRSGDVVQLQCAHIIPRANLVLRWDFNNALSLCYACHLFWAHKNPLEFTEWFRAKFPDRYEYLLVKKNLFAKWTLEEYQGLCELLRAPA